MLTPAKKINPPATPKTLNEAKKRAWLQNLIALALATKHAASTATATAITNNGLLLSWKTNPAAKLPTPNQKNSKPLE